MVGDSDDLEVAAFDWDDANIRHIAGYHVTPEDAEYVLANGPLFFRNLPGRSATHVMIGRDEVGRILYLPIRCVEWPDVWRVISAWESRYARTLYPGS